MANEDPTQDISQKYETKPTIETVLERINALGEALSAQINDMRGQLDDVRGQLDRVESRLMDFDVRLDRVEGVVNATRSEMLVLRADFKEFRGPKEPASR
jgi:chromosome segregation ATPase